MSMNRVKFSNLKNILQLTQPKINVTKSFTSNATGFLSRNGFLEVSDEIKCSNKPLVALESTIITHGLPYPTNLETALEVEHEIRSNGAVPATIGLLNGKLKVGLSSSEIEYLAKNHSKAIKLSRRDLPFVFGKNDMIGGTTVATTMIGAHEAQIPLFCTGGIGGVHRDFIDSMDVSADLQELSRTPVCVVSSGVKSILDIEKTLEYLETMGVCVVTLESNGSKEFPAFFTSRSGFEAAYNCKTEQEVAALINTNLKAGLSSGLLVGVPIPSEYSMDNKIIDNAIQEALAEIKNKKIKGKQVTPFLLEKINRITKGKSLASNVALIKNNAKHSARIACQLNKLRKSDSTYSQADSTIIQQKPKAHSTNLVKDPITVVGGINLDNIYKLDDETTIHLKGVTQPCTFHQSLGGVGRNMCEALIRQGLKNSTLISTVGNDLSGRLLLEELRKIGFDITKIEVINNANTGSYFALFDCSGGINLACGSMKAHDLITTSLIQKNLSVLQNSEICVIDADLPIETIKFICDTCNSHQIPVWYNPTDLRKCMRIVEADSLNKLTYISPNLKELYALFCHLIHKDSNQELNQISLNYKGNIENIDFEDLKRMIKYLLKHVPFIFLSRGSKDFLVASSIDLSPNDRNQFPLKKTYQYFKQVQFKPQIHTFPIVELDNEDKFINETGAGDSTAAGIINGIVRNYSLNETIYNGLAAGKQALLTEDNVSKNLSLIDLDYIKKLIAKKRPKFEKILL